MIFRRSKIFVFAALLMAGLVALAPRGVVTAGRPEVVTARLGVSAGADIEDAPLGLDGRELRTRIPILYETADRLGVHIRTVSVGQGFFADEGQLLSEHDLDLVVTGNRDAITTMAATLGKAWNQSVVFIWFQDRAGPIATATIPLPRGAEALSTEIYEQLVTELADGGHVRYAGRRSLIFVANTGDESDTAFFARMERARTLLARAGVATGPMQCGRAQFLAVERANYDDVINGRIATPAFPTVTSTANERGGPSRRCA